ncbi:MAG: hypothetical protein M1833_003611 [Piccolia ochrophora]|nr:MAG: hypothetical protein M1833_003611 [Piccolia ochrophora]
MAPSALHLLIQPRPLNLHDTRHILRHLQTFGEVLMFKSLRYASPNPSPHSALAILSSPSSFLSILNASPLTVHVPAEMPLDITLPPLFDAAPPSAAALDDGSRPRTGGPRPLAPARTLTLTASASAVDPASYVRRQPFHGAFAPDLTSGPARELKGRVGVGLRDWGWERGTTGEGGESRGKDGWSGEERQKGEDEDEEKGGTKKPIGVEWGPVRRVGAGGKPRR